MNIIDFNKNKKITMITCYDYTSAQIVANSNIDCVLVGDSVAMTMHGYPDTTHATVTMMVAHTQAVARGCGNKFIVADMPFLSYRRSLDIAVDAAGQLIQAGADAIKLEGAKGNLELIQHLVESGIPVMGHVGLTPQFVNVFGGFKVQGKTDAGAKAVLDDALALQQAGCFAVVLECIPARLAATVTESLSIPTIGIGAGEKTSGQVLVWQDMLGMNDLNFKFMKKYLNGAELIQQSINRYVKEVTHEEFPSNEHCYAS